MSLDQIALEHCLAWPVTNDGLRSDVQTCLNRTNWKAVCDIASRARKSQDCIARQEFTYGGSHLARLLQFEDGTHWVARIQLAVSTPETASRARADVDTMALLKSRTQAPVPRVFISETDDTNPTGFAFSLLEFLPGNTAYVESQLTDETQGALIPRQFRQTFYSSTAAAHVQIASARLPQIGAVSRDASGNFVVGPIPGLGGPFNTAALFIQAWAAHVRFPYGPTSIRDIVPISLADEILEGIDELPSRLAQLATTGKYFTTTGPFPIRHPDLYHSNIVVTKKFEVLGVIDWEGAHTVPWEWIDAPRFLTTVPRQINPPEQYHEGRPVDADEANRWKEREEYTEMVLQAERAAGTDHRLSSVLADGDMQDLAGVMHLFSDGKLGLYGRALRYFE